MLGVAGDGRKERASALQLLGLLREAGPWVVTGLVLMGVAQVVIPLAIISATGTLVGRVTAGADLAGVTEPLLMLAGLFGLQQVLAPIGHVFWYRASNR